MPGRSVGALFAIGRGSPFKKIEEVMNVRGIGEKSFPKIKDQLTVATAKAEK